MKKTVIAAMAMAICLPAAKAQDASEPKLKVAPTGRVLMDGALFASPDKEAFKDGATLSDIRLGAKATYGKWTGKIDVGFAQGKVGLKDVYIQYDLNDHSYLRAGSFIHQYGIQASSSSSMKCSFEEPLSNTVFNASRQVGVMYVYSAPKFYGTFSAHVEPQSLILTPNQLNQEGYGLLTRLVARPIAEDGMVLQFGVSGGFASPQTNGENKPHDAFAFSGNFPTRVDKVTAVSATITDAMNMFKFSPELLLNYGPVALEAQYFYNQVNMRHGLHSFLGQGAYALVRTLLCGQPEYKYNSSDASLKSPVNSLELTLGYNYTTLSDSKAQRYARNENGQIMYDGPTPIVLDGIYGGRANQASATLSYYVNKYITARLNYTYTHRWDAASLFKTDLNVFQARLQILF